MTEYFQKNLSKDISMEEYKRLFTCLNGRSKQFQAGETICDYDQGFNDIGIIGKGTAFVIRYEFNGAGTILERLGPQDIFGHLLSYEGGENAGISVVSDSACDVLFIHYATISSLCAKTYTYHRQLAQSLLDMVSERVLNLSRRVEALSQHIAREKLIRYFLQLAAQAESSSFRPPFTMVDLTDYLSIDRSAMTRELKCMKEKRIIEMDKRSVRLYT